MLDLKLLLTGQKFAHRGAANYLLADDKERAEVEQLLNDHGFTDMSIIGAGTNAFVMRDNTNPDLVVRIAQDFPEECGGGDERAVIPQVLQAIFSRSFLDNHIPIKVEILPCAGQDKTRLLRDQFNDELKATQLIGKMKKCDDSDLGVFGYTERGESKKVLMAIDDSVFDAAARKDPKCTANYPSLAVQQARHQELWEADERLQKLLPDGPAKLPETRIVPSTSRGDIPRG